MYIYICIYIYFMYVYTYIYIYIGLVGLILRNGGAAGMGRVFARYATTSVRAQLLTAGAGLMVFFDDYSSILIVGPTMRPVADACGMSRFVSKLNQV
jgi:Na+/H+ antiporter NhaC